jgi:hypothetical protein
MRNPLIWAGTLLLLVLTIGSAIVANAIADALHAWGEAPKLLSAQLSRVIDGDPNSGTSEGMMPLRSLVIATVDAAVDRSTTKAMVPINAAVKNADARLNDAIKTVNDVTAKADARTGEALGIVKDLNGDLKPLLAKATTLTANYAALPDRLAAEMRPSWLAIQPEITCRQADGTGYGGCWHSRVTGLMGEALKVGGVFTQKFPSLADSTTGIASDIRSMTKATDERFFHPPPRTLKQKIAAGFKDVIFAGSGLARLVR